VCSFQQYDQSTLTVSAEFVCLCFFASSIGFESLFLILFLLDTTHLQQAISKKVRQKSHFENVFSVTLMHPAKAVGWNVNGVPFGLDICVVQSNYVLARSLASPMGRGDLGVRTPIRICIADFIQTVTYIAEWLL